MKYIKFLMIVLSTFSFVSCSSTTKPLNSSSPNPVSQNSPKVPTINPFEKLSFPQSSCGDPLNNTSSSPVQMYPVLLDYSENNLKKIKQEFCADAFIKNQSTGNSKKIQTALFKDIDTAKKFQEFIQNKVGNAEIGDIVLIEGIYSSPTELNTKCGETKQFYDLLISSECPPDLDKDSRPDYRNIVVTFKNPTKQVRTITFEGDISFQPTIELKDRPDFGEYYEYFRVNRLSSSIPEVLTTVKFKPGQKIQLRKRNGGIDDFSYFLGTGKHSFKYQEVSEVTLACLPQLATRGSKSQIFGVSLELSCGTRPNPEPEEYLLRTKPRDWINIWNRAADPRIISFSTTYKGIEFTYTKKFVASENEGFKGPESFNLPPQSNKPYKIKVFIP
ncbi:hypothetical protein FJR38_01955 [Anabaena sp. UHCC 0253]|uniref:hypothetical protein n=1 Tax=Anabaena sp. UHCC 0253 TaxID=2590019 RepID=UPI001445E22D|nr:hypothetical protein [Anabaena sp. UHCC 0253]MTJ51534.1 hypothetical protein [Anabaena sp. UHCC 0253]